jgi:lipoyl(octanoyl) transferase
MARHYSGQSALERDHFEGAIPRYSPPIATRNRGDYVYRTMDQAANTRGAVTIGLLPGAHAAPVEWVVSDQLVAYDDALAVMAARVAAIARGEKPELVWLLQHPPLYTAGTSAQAAELIEARFPVHTVGRGGQFTYHGPGQRVGYVMLDLKQRTPDVRRFVATLEEWIIRALVRLSVRGERRSDRVGVWVRRPEKGEGFEDKIAAIGLRVQRWVTLHGFALNVAPDLSHFAGIVPCGVSNARYGVTSLAELGGAAALADVDKALRTEFTPLFGAVGEDQALRSTENNSSTRRSAISSCVASR